MNERAWLAVNAVTIAAGIWWNDMLLAILGGAGLGVTFERWAARHRARSIEQAKGKR